MTGNIITVRAGNRRPGRNAYRKGTFAWVRAGVWNIERSDGAISGAHEAVIHTRRIEIVSRNSTTRIDSPRFGTRSPRHIKGCEEAIVATQKAVLDPDRVNEVPGYCPAWVNTKRIGTVDGIRRVKGDNVATRFAQITEIGKPLVRPVRLEEV